MTAVSASNGSSSTAQPGGAGLSLARRPYDLRHACLSTWLNGGIYPTQVAERAGPHTAAHREH
jgi:hypothetical protein